MDERQERGLRVLLALQAVVCTAIGIWGAFSTKILSAVLGLRVSPAAIGVARVLGAVMIAVAIAYALAAAQPHRNRAFLVPLFLIPLVMAVAMIANIASGDVQYKVRAGAFTAYLLAYCLLHFRVYPRVPDAPAKPSEPPRT